MTTNDLASFQRKLRALGGASRDLEQAPVDVAEACAERMRHSHPWVSRTGETEGSIVVVPGDRRATLSASGATVFLERGTRHMRARPFYAEAIGAAPAELDKLTPSLRRTLEEAAR